MKNRYIILIILGALLIGTPVVYFVGSIFYNLFVTGSIVDGSKKINKCYLEHNNSVYYYFFAEFYSLKKVSSDLKGFEVFSKDVCIGKDKKVVYFGDEVLKNADPLTYSIVYTGYFIYSKDNNSVFFDNELIDNADSATFMVRQDHPEYSQDSNNVFYRGKLMQGIKPQSLLFLYDESLKQSNEYVMDTLTKKVYFRGSAMDADGISFKIVKHEVSKDKDHVFYKDQIIPNFDPTSLQLIGDSTFIKDKNNVLIIHRGTGYKSEYAFVENVDVAKFKMYSSGSIKYKGEDLVSGICGDGTSFFSCNTGSKLDSKFIEFVK